jgi:hypothetical protein
VRRLLMAVLGIAVLALLLRLIYGQGNLGFDAAFSLVWGDELRHFQSPDYAAAVTPTPHPLGNFVAAFASFAGDRGPAVLTALSFFSFAGLGVAAFAAGRRTFGAAAGCAFAAILLTRPLLIAETLQSSTDIPFLALVLAALALELRRERCGPPVLVLLAIAGLLRPEAWGLSVLYGVYLLWPERHGLRLPRVLSVGALAFSGMVLWLGFDLLTTGDPAHSFTRTQDLAAHLKRERGVTAAVRELPPALRSAVGGAVTWLGVAAGALAVFVAQRRSRLGLGLLVFGIATWLALGVAQLPLINRYLLIPSAALALFCAAGLTAFVWLHPEGRMRRAGVAISIVTAVMLIADVPALIDDLNFRLDRSGNRQALYDGLLSLADTAQGRGLVANCERVQVAIYRPVPALAYKLRIRPSKVIVVRPAKAKDGLVFAPTFQSVVGDVGLYPGVVIPDTALRVPPSFKRVGSNAWGQVATRGC